MANVYQTWLFSKFTQESGALNASKKILGLKMDLQYLFNNKWTLFENILEKHSHVQKDILWKSKEIWSKLDKKKMLRESF